MEKVKQDTFVMLVDFARNDYDLKGNELIVYCIIYGYSKNGDYFTGTRKYLASWTGTSVKQVGHILATLVEKGLITKKTVIENNVTYCHYKVTRIEHGKSSIFDDFVIPRGNDSLF